MRLVQAALAVALLAVIEPAAGAGELLEGAQLSPFRWMFYGVMVAMILYSGLTWAVVRDASYREYALSLIAVLVFALGQGGDGARYLWGASPWLASYLLPLSLGLAVLFITRFNQTYLQTASRPHLHATLTAVGAAGVFLAIGGFVLPQLWLNRVANLTILFSAIASPLVVIALALAGSRAARFLAVAILPETIGVLIQVAAQEGALPEHPLAVSAGYVGFALGIILQSLGLADNLNHERRERARLSRLRRFFAPQVAQAILAEGGEEQLAPRRRDVTVVFTDLRGFTTFAAGAPPEEVMRVLREYHEVVGRLVTRHEGTLEHFAGDGVMIFFNAPLAVADPERRAARMAIDLRGEFARLRAEWAARGHDLGVGIGIDCGAATVGRVGTDERWNYAAIGPVTNLAARLCGRAAHGEILVSAPLRDKLDGAVTALSLGEQAIKGLPQPVPVFSLEPAP